MENHLSLTANLLLKRTERIEKLHLKLLDNTVLAYQLRDDVNFKSVVRVHNKPKKLKYMLEDIGIDFNKIEMLVLEYKFEELKLKDETLDVRETIQVEKRIMQLKFILKEERIKIMTDILMNLSSIAKNFDKSSTIKFYNLIKCQFLSEILYLNIFNEEKELQTGLFINFKEAAIGILLNTIN